MCPRPPLVVCVCAADARRGGNSDRRMRRGEHRGREEERSRHCERGRRGSGGEETGSHADSGGMGPVVMGRDGVGASPGANGDGCGVYSQTIRMKSSS